MKKKFSLFLGLGLGAGSVSVGQYWRKTAVKSKSANIIFIMEFYVNTTSQVDYMDSNRNRERPLKMELLMMKEKETKLTGFRLITIVLID